MSNPVLLHSLDHKDLRIIRDHGAAYGDDITYCSTFPTEFRDVQSHYPIVFRETGDGNGFEAVALFGFEQGENLFLGPQGWDAGYVPMAVERQPFLIGRVGDELNVHIDLDSPRISTTRGEALFLEFGGRSEYLEHVNALLFAIHEGLESMPAFIGTLKELDLLESFVAEIELADGTQHRLMGFHTINEDKLRDLPGAVLERLSRSGHLQAIYMTLASLSNFRALIERKQRRLAAHG